MNERIKELMIEAGKTIPGDKHIDADFCEKFAELIIRECMELVEDGVIDLEIGRSSEGVVIIPTGAAEVIAEHFGVE